MKANVMRDAEYSNSLLIELETDGVEALLFDFLKHAKIEHDGQTFIIRLSDEEWTK